MLKTKIGKRKWLILPVETKSRELYGKMLLSCVAAEKGWGVLIGSKSATRDAPGLPKGVILDKSISPGRLKDIESLQLNGQRVSVCDEEGLLYVNLKWYEQRRFEKASFEKIDYFFAWGQQHKADILQILGAINSDKIVVSGNPRFDLLREEFHGIYKKSSSHLKAKYGRIILINSNFLFVNSGAPDSKDYLSYLKSIGKITDLENEETWRRLISFGQKNLDYFIRMLPRLSDEFPEHTIVIRPHPSEDDSLWIRAASGLPNVKVLFEDSANEWILSSEVSIQNNCTTAVEAFMLDKPAISYRPFRDDEIEFKLPNAVSFEAYDLDGLVNTVRRLVSSKDFASDRNLIEEREKQFGFARSYISNVQGRLASDTIMDTLGKLSLPEAEPVFSESLGSLFKRTIGKVKKFLNKDVYTSKKFPGISLSEVRGILAEFQHTSNRFHNIKIVQIDLDGFCVYKY